MTGERARWTGLLLTALLGCGPAPAPVLPAGRVVAGLAVDGERAAWLLADYAEDRGVLAVVDARGAPVWAQSLPLADFRQGLDGFPAGDLVRQGDALVLHGDDTHVFVLADGQRRARLPGPDGEAYEREWQVVGEQLVRLVNNAGEVRLSAVDLADGAERWQREMPPLVRIAALRAPGVLRIESAEPGRKATPMAGEMPVDEWLLGAAAITGALPVDEGDVRDGRVWLFSEEQQARGTHAPAVLDARTLQVVAGPGPGLRVLDFTTEARVAARPPAAREVGVTWDPLRDGEVECGRDFPPR